MVGTLLWQSFVDALNSPIKSVSAARAMLSKINFPKEALLLSGMMEVIFNLGVRLLLLIPLFLYFKLPIGAPLLLAPVGIAVLLLTGMAMGLLITPVAMLYSDVGRGLTMVTAFWMLLTPVVYPPPAHGLGGFLARWNPASPLIIAARDWLTATPTAHWGGLVVVSVLAFLVLLLAWLAYRLTMPMLIERMGG
jgi:lipopolysaccharide transport system permease protein